MKEPQRGGWHHRVAFAVTCTLVLFLLVLIPFAVGDAVGDLLGPPEGRVYPLAAPATPSPLGSARLHVALVGLSELQQTATLRVSGHYHCAARCDWQDRIVFAALRQDEAEGMAPSASVTLDPSDLYLTQTIELPARGHSSRYPFDHYDLALGVLLQRVYPDGRVQIVSPAEAQGQLYLSLQEEIARMTMDTPRRLDPATLRGDRNPYEYLYLVDVQIQRPLYLRILAVLLVLLVASASAYAVFMRPLQDLVMNAGALVVGIWGVRAMLVPMPWTWLTSIDLSLSVVIIFLLGAITIRAAIFLWARSGFHLRRAGPEPPEAGAAGR